MANIEIHKFLNLGTFIKSLDENEIQVALIAAIRRAKQLVRVDKGILRRSIDGKVINGQGVIGSDVEYAASQEYGLSNQATRQGQPGTPKSGKGGPYTFNPFLRPAAKFTADDLNAGKYTPEAVRKALRDARI